MSVMGNLWPDVLKGKRINKRKRWFTVHRERGRTGPIIGKMYRKKRISPLLGREYSSLDEVYSYRVISPTYATSRVAAQWPCEPHKTMEMILEDQISFRGFERTSVTVGRHIGKTANMVV